MDGVCIAGTVQRMNAHTDIRAGGWVAALPEGWRPYALLMRADRPIGSWLLFLPGSWALSLAAPDIARGLWLALLFGIGAVVMRGAGCVVNDIWDRDLDRQVTRTAMRPLASGAVSLTRALVFLGVLAAIGLLILMALPPAAIVLGAASLIPVAVYPLAKRFTDWPQAVLGVVFSWAAPMGWVAARGALEPAALALWLAAFCWILGYDTIYAHQDREDDAKVGVGSSALSLGERTRPFVAACYAAMLGCLGLAGWMAGVGPWFWPVLLLPAALLARQVVKVDIHDPVLCLRLFNANREVGIAVAMTCLAGRL